MVPEGYAEFFVASASVAGALVGLLFVAVSVRPSAAARSAHITVRLRAVAALSAFLNPLFVSLLALRPHASLGGVSITLGAIGLAAMVTLLALLVAEGRDRPWPLARGALLVIGQGAIYVLQLLDGIALTARPDDADAVDNVAVLVVVLFALGVARAWEFIGADNPSLLGAAVSTVTGVSRRRREQDGPTSEPGTHAT